MKATEQYFPAVLDYYAVQGGSCFESVDEILKCVHSNESYWAVHSCGAVYYALQGGSDVRVGGPVGVLSVIRGRGVSPGSPNPDPIPDQNMPFFTPVFRPDLL